MEELKVLDSQQAAIDKDMMVFALKDMSFLRDDTKRRLEIKTAQEELDNLNEVCRSLKAESR